MASNRLQPTQARQRGPSGPPFEVHTEQKAHGSLASGSPDARPCCLSRSWRRVRDQHVEASGGVCAEACG